MAAIMYASVDDMPLFVLNIALIPVPMGGNHVYWIIFMSRHPTMLTAYGTFLQSIFRSLYLVICCRAISGPNVVAQPSKDMSGTIEGAIIEEECVDNGESKSEHGDTTPVG